MGQVRPKKIFLKNKTIKINTFSKKEASIFSDLMLNYMIQITFTKDL